jgi:hypothetical protein
MDTVRFVFTPGVVCVFVYMDSVFLSLSISTYSLVFFLCQPYGLWCVAGVALLVALLVRYDFLFRGLRFVLLVRGGLPTGLCVLYVLVRLLVALNCGRVVYVLVCFPFWVVYARAYSSLVATYAFRGVVVLNVAVVLVRGRSFACPFGLVHGDYTANLLHVCLLTLGCVSVWRVGVGASNVSRCVYVVYVLSSIFALCCVDVYDVVSFGLTVFLCVVSCDRVCSGGFPVHLLCVYLTLFPLVLVAATVVEYNGVHVCVADVVVCLVLWCYELDTLSV